MRQLLAISVAAFGALLLGIPVVAQDVSGEVGPIQDNSFLIEEAYNQEAGVVQHISVLDRARHGGDWEFSFTQEWPAPGIRHQLSYTVPVARLEGHRGVGDVALNYRYQLLGDADARLAVAPRASLLLPTGDSDRGLGAGGTGIEVALPVSAVVSKGLVTHWNVGVNQVSGADDGAGHSADLTGVFAGEGLIWLARPTLNVLLEARWDRAEAFGAGGRVEHEESLVLSPGVRFAQNRPRLQVIYGVGFPFEVGAGDGDRSVLLYLSFEHPFR